MPVNRFSLLGKWNFACVVNLLWCIIYLLWRKISVTIQLLISNNYYGRRSSSNPVDSYPLYFNLFPMVSRGILGNEVEISSERIGESPLESFTNLLGQTLTSQVVFYPYGIQNVGSSVTNRQRNSKLTTTSGSLLSIKPNFFIHKRFNTALNFNRNTSTAQSW